MKDCVELIFAAFIDAGDDGLGFTVVTRAGHNIGRCMVYVKKILQQGAAAKDGRLKPGDLILEVIMTFGFCRHRRHLLHQ